MLDGYTIVALATYIPGPVAAARLRALGARVVKIEPAHGDPLAHAAPEWYARLHAGIEVRRRDMRAPQARDELFDVLDGADLLISAMRARSLVKMGLDEASLRARYARLSHVALAGEMPPNDDRAGHDLTYQARAGTIVPPAMPRALIGDMAAAERVVSTSLGALLARERTGATTFATIGITECAAECAAAYEHGLTRAGGELGGAFAGYALYQAADGWVALAALEPHFAQRVCEVLAIASLDEGALQSAFRTRTAQAWEAIAEQHDLPLAAVR